MVSIWRKKQVVVFEYEFECSIIILQTVDLISANYTYNNDTFTMFYICEGNRKAGSMQKKKDIY